MLKVIDEKCTPTRGTKYSACVDLRSRVDVKLEAGTTVIIPLGVKIDLTDFISDGTDKLYVLQNYYIDVKPRSSIRAKGLIAGSGVIDLDYPDEIGLILYKPLTIVSVLKSIVSLGRWKTFVEFKKGERIAQAMVKRHYTDFFGIYTDKLRDGGVGSTGKE